MPTEPTGPFGTPVLATANLARVADLDLERVQYDTVYGAMAIPIGPDSCASGVDPRVNRGVGLPDEAS